MVSVLDRVTDGNEQLQPLSSVQIVFVAVLRKRNTSYQLHDEIGASPASPAERRNRRCTRVQHLGDVWVIHHRQGLPFGLESGDDLLCVHAEFDNLQRHLAAHRIFLLGHVDDAEAAFPQKLEQFVATDGCARALAHSQVRVKGRSFQVGCRRTEKRVGLVVGLQQRFNPRAQSGVAAAGAVQIAGTLGRSLSLS